MSQQAQDTLKLKQQPKQSEYKLTLHSGDQMPMVGFGTWKLPNQVASELVYNAIKNGYTLVDAAATYGNQKQVGEGINKAISQNIISRENLFITSKLWNTFHKKQHVRPALLRTLSDLNQKYLDLYLIHYPISLKYVDPSIAYPTSFEHEPIGQNGPQVLVQNVPILQTWQQMQKLVEEGLVKNIGVSNFNVSLLRDLLNSSKIKPSVNQVQLHPYLTQKKLIKFCQNNGIQVTSYSTMGGASYLQLFLSTKQQLITQTPTILQIAKKYNKTGAQVIFRWAIQQKIAIIPKTSKINRLHENRDVQGWELSGEDVQKIDGLNKGKRYCDPLNFFDAETSAGLMCWG